MHRLVATVLIISAPALAQDKAPDTSALQQCPPIGQTARGELIYSLNCKAIKTDYTVGEHKPDMPATNLSNTVIPKAGGKQTPDETPTKGETR